MLSSGPKSRAGLRITLQRLLESQKLQCQRATTHLAVHGAQVVEAASVRNNRKHGYATALFVHGCDRRARAKAKRPKPS